MVDVDNKTRPHMQVDSDKWLNFRNAVGNVAKHTDLLDCFFVEYAKNPDKFDDMLLIPNNINTWRKDNKNQCMEIDE